jgi:hypothetical protein
MFLFSLKMCFFLLQNKKKETYQQSLNTRHVCDGLDSRRRRHGHPASSPAHAPNDQSIMPVSLHFASFHFVSFCFFFERRFHFLSSQAVKTVKRTLHAQIVVCHGIHSQLSDPIAQARWSFLHRVLECSEDLGEYGATYSSRMAPDSFELETFLEGRFSARTCKEKRENFDSTLGREYISIGDFFSS